MWKIELSFRWFTSNSWNMFLNVQKCLKSFWQVQQGVQKLEASTELKSPSQRMVGAKIEIPNPTLLGLILHFSFEHQISKSQISGPEADRKSLAALFCCCQVLLPVIETQFFTFLIFLNALKSHQNFEWKFYKLLWYK